MADYRDEHSASKDGSLIRENAFWRTQSSGLPNWSRRENLITVVLLFQSSKLQKIIDLLKAGEIDVF